MERASTQRGDGSSGKKSRRSSSTAFVLASLLAASITTVGACVVDNSHGPPSGVGGSGGSGGNGGSSGSSGPCTEGTTRECSYTIGNHGGVLTCFEGVAHCEAGAWGPCVDGKISARPAPPEPPPGQSNVMPTPCQNNPCDPSCQVFEEDPDAGIRPDAAAPTWNWETGNLGDFPVGLVNKGLQEPCDEASDCQFNMHCKSPVTGTCSHHKCATGTGLDKTCDPCVTKICTQDPTCCFTPYAGTCAHDPCIVGAKLKSTCDATCVKKVCQAIPSCCSTTWDAACVAQMAASCGKDCNQVNGNWSQACVDKVYSTCGAECQFDPPCAHDKCYAGPPLNAACDPCVASICQQTGYCCSSVWDNICVDKVKSLCGVSCPPKGDCVPWLPNEKDPKCPGIDLALGVPCNGTLPVCNHGNTDAPAGIKIIHFPANSNQYPKCDPDQSHPQMVTCTTPAPIKAGECIDVTTCGLTNGNREVMVNPSGAGHVNECFCENNWTLYSGQANACEPPTCSAVTSRTIRPVNMFVQFDRSGSMTINDRWGKATAALKAFFSDPASGGIGVALRFWEHFKPVAGCDDTACSIDACSSPLVPLAKLTTAPAPADTQEKALIDAINSVTPAADTPLYPALGGAAKWAKALQLANPQQQYVIVFVTDGYPNSCNTDSAQIAALAEDAFVNAGVLTYAIGIQDANVALMNSIAQKGGTTQAFIISDAGDVQQQLLSALLQIKGDTVACEFPLPNLGTFDPSNAKVTLTSSSGMQTVLSKVAAAASCGNGWYFDDPAAPAKILLCPTTCQTVLADAGAQIDVDLGCPGAYQPATYTQIYQATCPAGTKVQWGYFAYNTATPGDSNVIFDARTATSQALLSGAFTTLATAKAAPIDTQVCAMGGPAPCPVDMYTKLSLPAARQEFLEFRITMNPTTDKAAAPTVNNWDITYSCPASE